MIEYAIGILPLTIGLAAITLQRLYSSVPTHELRRLAHKGDTLAAALYRVAAYGASLRLLLWIVASVGVATGLTFILPALSFLLCITVLVIVLLLALVILPSISLTQRSAQAAAQCVPVVQWLLMHLHTLLDRAGAMISRFRELPVHNRLYEKEDLINLIERQRKQADNRIADEDLDLMVRALTFKNTSAADVAQPRKKAHLVNASDSIGPILLDQLHKQHQASFLVYKDAQSDIIGTLTMNDAITAKHGGKVADLIRNDLIYVHEDFSARQVLTAFYKTGHQIAAVINNAEELVGVITAHHLLAVLLGDIQDDEGVYSDRAHVAAYQPQPIEPQSVSAPTQLTNEGEASTEILSSSSPEATEVVE
jgi:CBS domain containing-hemolysin-like protein